MRQNEYQWSKRLTLSNDKILDCTKQKPFTDDKIKAFVKLKNIVCFRMCRKHCGNKRKCWFPAFSLFPTMFSHGFKCFQSRCKSALCGKELKKKKTNPDFIGSYLTLSQTSPGFYVSALQDF